MNITELIDKQTSAQITSSSLSQETLIPKKININLNEIMKTSDTSVQTQRQFPLTVNNKVKKLSLLKRKNSNHQIPFK